MEQERGMRRSLGRTLAAVMAGAMLLAACSDGSTNEDVGEEPAADEATDDTDEGADDTADEGADEDESADGQTVDLTAAASELRSRGYNQVADSVEQAEAVDGAPESLELEDGSTFELAPSIAEKIANGDPINYVFSYQSTGIPLFSDQYERGYEATLPVAQEILPMNGTAVAPPGDIDIPQQISQIEALLNTGQIDCLAIEPPDSNAFTDITNRAISEGIPVFTAGVTSNGNEFTNFTQIPVEEGRFAAETVLAWMEETGNELQTFTVSGGDPSAFWAQGRMQGFEEGIREALPDAEFLNTVDDPLSVTYDPAQTYDAYQALLTGQPDLDFILNVDIGAEHAARAIEDAGLTGDVFTAGWNVSLGQLDAIEAGRQVAAFDQRWPEQAGFGAPACAVYLATGRVTPNTQQLRPVTTENVEEARANLEQILE